MYRQQQNLTTCTSSLPPPSALSDPSLPPSAVTNALDLLFEPSPTLHHLAVPIIKGASTPFATYADLIAAVEAQLKALAANGDDTHQLDSILGSHPRLGEKKVDSALSRKEQAAMGQQDAAAADQANDDFAALNAMYEQTFPGLRFVTFVNARPRSVIAVELRNRVERGDIAAERVAAIEAMCAIANDRASKLSVAI
ncbi:Oxo-4-hydroxy-4-carboxy-5-ureidoimidazoline decarboxylase [Phyllosticta citriasiana]|uniref:Oxo-4-hydroxy-4-carboxy-5-ureidoimidazoline decarboxylase n=1 Tax=Phyllosticta citriasiana TaxID=595635 RepID=A0ABR1KNJ2_9PEZI